MIKNHNKNLGSQFTIHGISFRLVNSAGIIKRDMKDGGATVYCLDLNREMRLPMPKIRKNYLIGLRRSIEYFLARGEKNLDFMYKIEN